MAREYFEKLNRLLDDLDISSELGSKVEVKHFFSGAALYVDSCMCASWSPAGLAFKLPEKEVSDLIASGAANPLKYFARGHVKAGYAVFENPAISNSATWKGYFMKAAQQVGKDGNAIKLNTPPAIRKKL